MLVIERVTVRPRARSVLSEVSLLVEPGEIVGLLGVAGSGKTALLRVASGLLEPDAGTVRVVGVDIQIDRARAQSQLGYMAQNAPLPPDLSVREYLWWTGRARGLDRTDLDLRVSAGAKELDLGSVLDVPLDRLADVGRRRVSLAAALLHDPVVLVLDDPFCGLDPVQKLSMRAVLRRFAARRSTLVAMRSLEDVPAICTHVAVIQGGRIAAAKTTPEAFAATAAAGRFEDAFLKAVTGHDPGRPMDEPFDEAMPEQMELRT